MPRKKLVRKKNVYLQVAITPDDKEAFEAWCLENDKTMSDVVREEIAPYIAKGRRLLSSRGEGNYSGDVS